MRARRLESAVRHLRRGPRARCLRLTSFDDDERITCLSCEVATLTPCAFFPDEPNGLRPAFSNESKRDFGGRLGHVVVKASEAQQGRVDHQQPVVNYLPRFGPQLISLER
jgi:hypothetical protein